MQASKIHPYFGVEVDIDLGRPLRPDQAAELKALFREHQLLVFRDQDLRDEDHLRAIGYLGYPLCHNPAGSRIGYVSNVVEGATVPAGELLFHSDMAYSPEPVAGISLYGLVVSTQQAVSTRFVSSAHALAVLPEELKRQLVGRSALHVYRYTLTVEERGALRQRESGLADAPLRATHPVAFECPFGGSPALYLSDMQTFGIEDMDKAQSDALLDQAFQVMYAVDAVYEHRWEAGDLLVWNNVALQHARGNVSFDGAPRTLRRVAFAARADADPWMLVRSLDRVTPSS